MAAGANARISTGIVAALLFGSGFCALVYQTTWFREFRLIFGASTAASAAVLAVFMGGLGIGGALLGRRVDRSGNGLRFYAVLEAGIALSAAATPLLLLLARAAYIASGGSGAFGLAGATVVRLLLTESVSSRSREPLHARLLSRRRGAPEPRRRFRTVGPEL